MSVDFVKMPSKDTSPIRLDFYKPEHVARMNAAIKAGEIIIEEKKLEAVPCVPVVMPSIVVEHQSIDSGASDEVVKAINKGHR